MLQFEHAQCISKARSPEDAPSLAELAEEGDEVFTRFQERMFDGPTLFYGLTGSVGYAELSHREVSDFSQHTSEKVPFSFSGYAGLFPNRHARYVGGGFEYKQDYKNPESRTLCQPGTSPQECFTGAFDSPERDTNATVFVAARAQWLVEETFPVGVELKLGYDFIDDAFGVGLPIYLFSDAEGQLRGGFRVGWDSDEDDFRFGIFIGAPFNLVRG